MSSDKQAYSYRFGTAEFDEVRFELKVAGLTVEVERRALELLAYLLLHAGEVVTKEELLQEVWAGRITVDKVLPNAITKLRRALGEANAEAITTVARVGYRLDAVISRQAVGRALHSTLALSAGKPVPQRGNFLLVQQLGKTLGSEVWLAEHGKTNEQRVYKFANDHDRLRALKREATLARVLQESLPESDHFLSIMDWNFEQAPYFLECDFGGLSLDIWAETHLTKASQEQRLEVFLQIVDAVADAHSVGVLHKDLKPANVLVDANGKVRLTDFGSGRLLDPDRLEALGISRMGMTENLGADASSGTPIYIAPEVFAGVTPSVRSDVFALGVMLYQLLSNRLREPMVSGWEADIADPLLQEDLRLATDGNSARRLSSAADFAQRLRALPERRTKAKTDAELLQLNQQTRAEAARARARRPFILGLIISLLAGSAISLWQWQQASAARNAARAELARANVITRFLTQDLVGSANPLVNAKGQEATMKDVLLAARERVAQRFVDQPIAEAAVRMSLANLFNAVDLWVDAEPQARAAMALYQQHDPSALGASEAALALVKALARQSKMEQAQAEIDALADRTKNSIDPAQRYLLAAARASYHMRRSEFEQARVALVDAIANFQQSDPQNLTQLDTLRLDLIAVTAIAGDPEVAKRTAQSLIDEALTRTPPAKLVVAVAKLSVARAYGEDHDQAQAQLLAAEPVILEQLGDKHSMYVRTLSELHGVAFRRGDWVSAARYGERTYQVALNKFGPTHTIVMVYRSNLARSLFESGRAAEALPHQQAAYQALVGASGSKSNESQDTGFLLAGILLELKQTQAAEQVLDTLDAEVLENYRPIDGWAHAIAALRAMALAQRNDPRAKDILRAAIEQMKGEENLNAPARMYLNAKAVLQEIDRGN